MVPITQKHRNIAIGTPLGEDVLLLRRFTLADGLSQPFELQLDLASERSDIPFGEILGQNVTVRLELPDGGTRHLNGIVNRFGHAGNRGRLFFFQATVVPWLWLLTRTADCRIFQDATAPDIVSRIFRERGFTDFRLDLSASYRQREYCVQYRESDFNFVSRLLEQEGIYYYFEHENGRHVLVLADSSGAHHAAAGYATIPFRPQDEGVHKRDFVFEFRAEDALQSGAYELTDFDFKAPRKNLRATIRQPAPHAFADLPVFDYPGDYTEFDHGRKYAQVRLQELLAQHRVYSGIANCRGFAVGHSFKLEEFPVAAFNQEYLLIETRCEAQGDALEPDSAFDSDKPFCNVQFSAIELATPFRSPSLTPRPIVQGPQTALVVGKAGEEIWTDQFGRVKVKFHWDRYSKADENSSCWIRVSQNWASKKWGTFFLPRIGQEVIVEFLEGDPDRPIVTGCVYNGDAPTPYDLPKEATKSTLKSNTSKGGNGFNEIRFEDKKGEEHIFIHAEKDEEIRIKNDRTESIDRDAHLTIGRHNKSWVGGNHDDTVSGSRVVKVSGSLQETIDGLHGSVVGKDRNHLVKGAATTEIKKDRNEIVRGSATTAVDKNLLIKAGMNCKQKTSLAHEIDGGLSISLKAGTKITIESGQQISLKAGSSMIVLDQSGVSIVGAMVKLNSGGSAGSATPVILSALKGLGLPLLPGLPNAALKAATGAVTKVTVAALKAGSAGALIPVTVSAFKAAAKTALAVVPIEPSPEPGCREIRDAKRYAILSEAAYDSEKNLVEGYDRIQPPKQVKMETWSNTGASLFRDRKTGQVILSFRGTDLSSVFGGAQDIWADARQELGGVPAQYSEGVVIAEWAKETYGDDLTITGHSKGGGQATYAAMMTNSKAIVFNAAPLGKGTQAKIDPEAMLEVGDRVKNYNVQGDLVSQSALRDKVETGAHQIGKITMLETPDSNASSLERHYMKSVSDALKNVEAKVCP